MNRIFTGMLLVFLNFNLDIGASRIGLIPSFLGYIFMVMGLKELSGLSGRFVKAAPWAKGMAVYSSLCYAMDLFGAAAALGEPVSYALGLISTAVSLLISYQIVMGVRDVEETGGRSLDFNRLYFAWRLLAVFSLVTYVLLIVPALAIVCMILGLAAGIYYLFVFNATKKLFYETGE